MHIAQHITSDLSGAESVDTVTLDYDNRFVRRKKMTTDSGEAFLVELADTRSVNVGDGFVLGDGRVVTILAAAEPLLSVTHDNPALIAWHIGNRHTPCQIGAGTLLIRDDAVLKKMLEQLGAETKTIHAPFFPEGGAYGHGRTHGHASTDGHDQ
ncbi:urease accessory protein UreE [Alphaproteobacteria bacterium]|jgi:urease accessory protein|nr:urease accessory protein UreE [Alphaproteobacteria bacterium]|tara:strand:- start:217 stop:678 length:462 start_codon:yes stop_codon:yes gene_type:complete